MSFGYIPGFGCGLGMGSSNAFASSSTLAMTSSAHHNNNGGSSNSAFRYDDALQSRFKSRMLDISESYHLLMEVGTQDPVMQHCLKTLQGMCLSQGIHMGDKADSSAIYDKSAKASSSSLSSQSPSSSSKQGSSSQENSQKSHENSDENSACNHSEKSSSHSHNDTADDTDDESSANSSGNSVQATKAFQKHLDKYYLPFCIEAIRCFFICGFVPWHLRRLKSTGDLVPEVLPLGTFAWHVELRSERMNRKRKESMPAEGFATSYVPHVLSRREGSTWQNNSNDKWQAKWKEPNKMNPEDHSVGTFTDEIKGRFENTFKRELGHPDGGKAVREDKESQYVQYRVTMNCGDLTEDEIFVYDFVPPNYGITNNSMMYATIASPVAHLLVDYKNLRQAQIRKAHAGKFRV